MAFVHYSIAGRLKSKENQYCAFGHTAFDPIHLFYLVTFFVFWQVCN